MRAVRKLGRICVRVILYLLAFAVFLVLLPLLLLLIFAPFKYAAVARVGKGTTVRVKASYLFRFVTIRYLYQNGKGKSVVRVAGFMVGGKEADEEKEEAGVKKKTTKRKMKKQKKEADLFDKESDDAKPNKLRNILTYSQLKIIISLIWQWLKKTVKVLLPKRFDVSGTVGFSDPSHTGMFFGAYECTAAMLQLRHKVRLTADFTEPGARLKISAAGSINIARLTGPLIRLVCKKPIRELIGTYFFNKS